MEMPGFTILSKIEFESNGESLLEGRLLAVLFTAVGKQARYVVTVK